MAARLPLPVWDTIVAAWNNTYGVKGSFWAAFGIMFAISFGIGFLEGLVPFLAPLLGLIAGIATLLLRAGAIYMGILRARNAPLTYQEMFRAIRWDLGFKVVVLYILQVLIMLPFGIVIAGSVALTFLNFIIGAIITLAAIFGMIYVTVRMSIAGCYVVDQEKGAWDAIKLSFAATRENIWPLIGIYLLFYVLFLISALPLGIGLIWTLPCAFVLYGTVYRKLAI